jgi:hypothetical protein
MTIDELILQAEHITTDYKFRDCEVGLNTWRHLTAGQGNIRALHFSGLSITPNMKVLEGRIWPKEGHDAE